MPNVNDTSNLAENEENGCKGNRLEKEDNTNEDIELKKVKTFAEEPLKNNVNEKKEKSTFEKSA